MTAPDTNLPRIWDGGQYIDGPPTPSPGNGNVTQQQLADALAALSGVPVIADVLPAVSINGALTVGKHNPVDATAANRAMTLANASGAGRWVSFEKSDTSANTVTLTFNLRGVAGSTISLTGANEARMLVSKADGSWWPVSDHRTKAFLDASYARTAVANTFVGTQTVQHGYLVVDRSTEGETLAPEQHLLGYNGWWISGGAIDVANNPKSQHVVPVAKGLSYYFNDGVTTNLSPTLTSASQGNFAVSQVGGPLVGPNIPAGTTILSVESPTSLTMSQNATADGTALRVLINRNGVSDLIFIRHNGGMPATIGLGVTPPDGTARVQISAGHSDNLAMDGVMIRQGYVGITGKYLRLTNNANTDVLWIDRLAVVEGANPTYGASLVVRGDATNNRALLMVKQDGSTVFGWQFYANGLKFRYITGGADLMQFDTSNIMSVFNDAQMLSAVTVGSAPRDGTHILQAQSKSITQGTLKLLGMAGQTANYLTIADSGNTPRLWVDSGGVVEGLNQAQGGSLAVRADATAGRTITMLNQAGTASYGWVYNSTSMKFRYISGGVDLMQFDTAQTMYVYGSIRHLGTGLGFFNKGSAATQQTVTGALSTVTDAAAKAVLTSILAALGASGYNLLLNGTT